MRPRRIQLAPICFLAALSPCAPASPPPVSSPDEFALTSHRVLTAPHLRSMSATWYSLCQHSGFAHFRRKVSHYVCFRFTRPIRIHGPRLPQPRQLPHPPPRRLTALSPA
jgi:hypothetical protein